MKVKTHKQTKRDNLLNKIPRNKKELKEVNKLLWKLFLKDKLYKNPFKKKLKR
jgi:hypothetical protein